jgi:hypothetical protein
MISPDVNTYHLGIWTLELLNPEDTNHRIGNVMLHIVRDSNNFLNWNGMFRTRMYVDSDPFSNKDIKQFEDIRIEGKTEKTVESEAFIFLSDLKNKLPTSDITYVEIKGDGLKLEKELSKHPDKFHIRKGTKEEFEKQYGKIEELQEG